MEITLRVHVVVRRISSNISGYTGPIFTIFSPYESALSADDRPVHFPICQATLLWQSILVKCHERRLIPLAFSALSLENDSQCHSLNVCINSGDHVATTCKNLVNFCRVTPEITGLICIPRYLYLATIDLHICIRHAAIQKRHGALERYTWYKFGGFLISISRIHANQLYTVGFNQHLD